MATEPNLFLLKQAGRALFKSVFVTEPGRNANEWRDFYTKLAQFVMSLYPRRSAIRTVVRNARDEIGQSAVAFEPHAAMELIEAAESRQRVSGVAIVVPDDEQALVSLVQIRTRLWDLGEAGDELAVARGESPDCQLGLQYLENAVEHVAWQGTLVDTLLAAVSLALEQVNHEKQ